MTHIPPEGFGNRLLIQGDGLPQSTHIYAVSEDGTKVELPVTRFEFEMVANDVSRVKMWLILTGVDLDLPYPVMIREYEMTWGEVEQQKE